MELAALQQRLISKSTLDVFYLAQIAAAIWRYSDQGDGEFPQPDDFDTFYAQQHELLNRDAWSQYYSPAFLAQPTSARFYRLPNLQDLLDSSGEFGKPRQKGVGHFTKLPRWAYNVTRTHWKQPTVSITTITKMALSTLKQTILQLQKDCPTAQIQPYSETQACFWLKYMDMDSPPNPLPRHIWKPPYNFGVNVALGVYDMWAWEAHYSPRLWASSVNEPLPLEPDLDGTRKSEIYGYGWPEGAGVVTEAWRSGWEPEVGSEEEIAFLAAVTLKETEGLVDMSSNLDYSIRSHMLLGVMRAAFVANKDKLVDNLKQWMVEAGRLDDETTAEQWIRQALIVMQPYTHKLHGLWPDAEEDRTRLFRNILEENGQLFAIWKFSPRSKEFAFDLKPKTQRG